MGKFGNRRLPRFMEDTNPNTERPTRQSRPIREESEHQILSLNGHGDDHAMITIRTQDGEEVELQFNYDGEGMLHAEHNGNTYTIPVEVEIASDKPVETEIDETHIDRLRKGSKYKYSSPSFDDETEFDSEVPQERGEPMYKFKGKKAAHLLPRKHVEDWMNDEEDEEEDGRAFESFTSYVIEEDCPDCGVTENYGKGMSDDAKSAIKEICEGLLIHEAHQHDSDENEDHTYESYLNECNTYLAECMMRSATNYKVGGNTE